MGTRAWDTSLLEDGVLILPNILFRRPGFMGQRLPAIARSESGLAAPLTGEPGMVLSELDAVWELVSGKVADIT